MFGGSRSSDRELAKTVSKRLIRAGGGTLTAAVQMGTVTLTGLLRYEAQRRPIVKAVSSIAGVSRVIDQVRLFKR
jgi:osmotically-inducible protein OsmY